MADNYKITQYSVNSILNNVESGQIAIPELQRPFVWKGTEVRDLIDSLYEGYPIGYLIVWQNSQVKLRNFGKGGTKKILIDGQQRVTALMASLLGREVLDDQYRSYPIKIAFNPMAGEEEERFAVNDGSYEEKPCWIPDISTLFKKDFSYRKFEKKYKDANPEADSSLLETAVDQLRGITKHQVGIVELSFLLDIDVVSEIFIRINLQGKPLNQEDFAMSKISVNEQFKGDKIRNSIDYFCHLLQEPSFMEALKSNEAEFMGTEYGKSLEWLAGGNSFPYIPSYADLLKVVLIAYFGKSKVSDLVNLLSGKTSHKGSISKKLSEESFKKLSDGVLAFISEKNFRGFIDALDQAGYCSGRLLYSQSLVNYCYAMYLMMDQEGISPEKKAGLIGRWMTMCLLTGHYQNSPDSIVMKDYAEIQAAGFESYLKQIEELRLSDDFFENVLPARYASTTARTAPFLAFSAAQCAAGTNALYSKEISMRDLFAGKPESYQILPKAYLEKCGFKTREIYGQVGNISYIPREVKAIVKRSAPADYKEKLLDILSQEEIAASLAAHGIPEGIFEADKKSVEDLLGQRRVNMARMMKEYYYNL
ncbi:MAG: DUF262 domain-containing protein [Eubacterium sp.]|nr:DUF262 domain-containing protein [Eubacterium sp.]